jgi:hypothetical protein
VLDTAGRRIVSDQLNGAMPLMSAEMKGLGQVQFQDPNLVTNVQKAYTPDDVARFFAADTAVDQYNYSSIREDLAMTFGEFMMAHRYGVRRDITVTPLITTNTTTSNLFVTWGQRGRIALDTIKPRLRLITQEITPWITQTDINALPAPIDMCPGQSYQTNLVLPCIKSAAASSIRKITAMEQLVAQRDFDEARKAQHERAESHRVAAELMRIPGTRFMNAR